jgi:hypothetical protein
MLALASIPFGRLRLSPFTNLRLSPKAERLVRASNPENMERVSQARIAEIEISLVLRHSGNWRLFRHRLLLISTNPYMLILSSAKAKIEQTREYL